LAITEGAFEWEDARLALMREAFPILHETIVGPDPNDEPREPSVAEWEAAVEREVARELKPSAGWQAAMETWWSELAKGRD